MVVSGPLLGYAARATPQFLKSSRQFFGFIIPRLENNERTENYQLTLKKKIVFRKEYCSGNILLYGIFKYVKKNERIEN